MVSMRKALQPCIALVLLACAPAAAGAAERSLEFPVKAAFLYKFGSFVAWPRGAFAGPRTPVQLCVVGHDPFGATLDSAVRGQTISGRPIAVRRLAAISPESGCHIAYLGGSSEQSPEAAVRAVEHEPVLTVSDAGAGADRVAIEFVIKDNRVRFRVDQKAAAASGLTISSKLLSLAVEVTR
jgi:hypothetical protein